MNYPGFSRTRARCLGFVFLLLLPAIACSRDLVFPPEYNQSVVLVPDAYEVSTTCNGYPLRRQFSVRDAETGAFILSVPGPSYRLTVDSTYATVGPGGLLEHKRDAPLGTPGTFGDNAFALQYVLVATLPNGQMASAKITQRICAS